MGIGAHHIGGGIKLNAKGAGLLKRLTAQPLPLSRGKKTTHLDLLSSRINPVTSVMTVIGNLLDQMYPSGFKTTEHHH
jgi:hypothetical protein